jgi:primary-amine oxidase
MMILAAIMAGLSPCTPGYAHPLDSLTSDEIKSAVAILRAEGVARSGTRFPLVKLAPPLKADVWNWTGGHVERRALVVMRHNGVVTEAVVDLARRTVLTAAQRRNVQTPIVPEEWSRAIALVKADKRWRAAMLARGISEARGIFCDALSTGPATRPEPRRLVKVPCYDARTTTNVYGKPIEGVMALVDLDADAVLEVRDTGVVPVSKDDPSLEQERQSRLQEALRPITASPPRAVNFTIDRNIVQWSNWSFHLSFDQRVGPIISTVRYSDSGRLRPILYQGHVSELFVPYMDAHPNWSFRAYMDVGEYGFGSLASKLQAGGDCPEGAMMLSVTMASFSGDPFKASDVMCLFERNTDVPLWRRAEIVSGSHEVRQDIELVLRTIPTVGNYDYVYDWVFNQKGEIRVDVGATGIAAAKGVAEARIDQAATGTFSGALVSPFLIAPDHDHFLAFRFDLDVDGQLNSFVRESVVPKTEGNKKERGASWVRTSNVERTELSLKPAHVPQLWRVQNNSARTNLGYRPSFEIQGGHSATSLLPETDLRQRRAAFSGRPLWITRYKPDELYASGDYPNQSAEFDGLPVYVNGEALEDQDLVAWYTMGFHHVTRPEDWPVLPTVRHSVTLRPHRFFDRNPGLNIPRSSGRPVQ